MLKNNSWVAGPPGLGLARATTEAGMECVVAAPSKLQRPAGDRIKTDARDAAHLAPLLPLGEITAVRVPEREVEAVGDLVRAREDAMFVGPVRHGRGSGQRKSVPTKGIPQISAALIDKPVTNLQRRGLLQF
jgi:hypothetical protein